MNYVHFSSPIPLSCSVSSIACASSSSAQRSSQIALFALTNILNRSILALSHPPFDKPRILSLGLT